MPSATMSGRRGYSYLKIIFLLFLLHSLSLYFYFRPSSSTPKPDLTNRIHEPRGALPHLPQGSSGDSSSSSGSVASRSMKPWPILPSYLPWTNPGHSPSVRSCEAFFGNGFLQDLPVISLPSSVHRGGGEEEEGGGFGVPSVRRCGVRSAREGTSG
ncbi:hypothetical protein MLD38_000571 [Melastoma candidum]|uniref:Uncharacterized protein n=1 Tax=Melastoma candidum TaxID=119954 RepID=A0ACB9SC35_9MYRT|nr:hypothetical protein MLD38_000571 [Melastoma candidum]